MTCDLCQAQVEIVYTYRGPSVPVRERRLGHGVHDVCAACLFDKTGVDYRGKSIGRVLHELALGRTA